MPASVPEKPLMQMPEAAPAAGDRLRLAVECAAGLFLQHGIAAVKMTDIAEASGIGVATLYRHFSTKVRLAVMAGTLLWHRFHASLRELVSTERFLSLDGLGRFRVLMGEYSTNYSAYPSFVSFLSELDHLIVSEGVDAETLAAYGAEVDSFYDVFEDAYLTGRADGSIVREVDFPVFFRAVAHAAMGVAEKISRGDVIPSDDFSRGAEELECIVNMAVTSLMVEN